MKKKDRRRRPRRAARRPGRSQPQYPMATVAYYGPDDQTVTKIAVGIIESEDAESIVERWYGEGVATDPKVQVQIAGFIEAHGAKTTAMTDGVLGCPHEEGIDFPAGQECPYCPFWHGKQGIVVEETQGTDLDRELKTLTRQQMRLHWEGAQLGMPLAGEQARRVQAMREHPEYSDLWGRLDELSDEEIERDGVNPILHITIHGIVENQIADRDPKIVRRVLKALMEQGLSRHEAIHRIGSALSEQMFNTLKDKRPFDERDYIRKLRRLVR